MLTRLRTSLLELKHQAGLQILPDELWKLATANMVLHSVFTQMSELNL